MRNKSKILLRKVSSLLKINNLSGNRHWPALVLATLETKYHLSPKEMLRLWYVRRRISNGKYPVDSLLIYDGVRASEKRVSVKSSRDLYSNADLLLFKGNIYRDGSVHLERVNN